MKTIMALLGIAATIFWCSCKTTKEQTDKIISDRDTLLYDWSAIDVNSSTFFIPMEFTSKYSILQKKIREESKTDSLYLERIRLIKDLDTLQSKGISLILKKYGEPILYQGHTRYDVFRLLVLSSKGAPKVIRVVRIEDSVQIIKKEGLQTKTWIDDSLKLLSAYTYKDDLSKWDTLTNLANNAEFWSSMQSVIDDQGVDGWTWIFEGKVDGKYKAVRRWAPTKESEFYLLCAYILKLGR